MRLFRRRRRPAAKPLWWEPDAIYNEGLLATTSSFLAQVTPPAHGVMSLDRVEDLTRRWLDLEFGDAVTLRRVGVSVLDRRLIKVDVDFREPVAR